MFSDLESFTGYAKVKIKEATEYSQLETTYQNIQNDKTSSSLKRKRPISMCDQFILSNVNDEDRIHRRYKKRKLGTIENNSDKRTQQSSKIVEKCLYKDCNEPKLCKSMCKYHYEKWYNIELRKEGCIYHPNLPVKRNNLCSSCYNKKRKKTS
jgi:hypothetical protein